MTAAQAALEEDEEDDDGGEEKTPKKAALKGLAEAYASEDDEDDEDDDDENEVDEASDKEAEDDGQFFDTSVAPSKAAEPVQKSATCGPPETPIQGQARPRTRKEWKCRKKLQPPAPSLKTRTTKKKGMKTRKTTMTSRKDRQRPSKLLPSSTSNQSMRRSP